MDETGQGKDNKLLLTKVIKDSFADVTSRPSFMEQVPIQEPEKLRQSTQKYLEAFSRIFQSLDSVPEAAQGVVYDEFLSSSLASSEGSELRLMLFGLKPAVITNIGGDYSKQWEEDNPGASIEIAHQFNIAKQKDIYPEVEVTYSDYGTPEAGQYEVVFISELVSQVVADNADIFQKLGYEPTTLSSELAREVFTKSDPIGMSLLLGYPLSSAILFNLYAEEDNHDPNLTNPRGRLFWQKIEAVTSSEQLTLLKELAKNPEQIGEMDLVEQTNGGKLTWENPRFKKVWQEAGVSQEINNLRTQLFGEDLPEDITEML